LPGCTHADAGADTSIKDPGNCVLLEHVCLTGDWGLIEWAIQNGFVLPATGVKGLVRILQTTDLKVFEVSESCRKHQTGQQLSG
jgi:hypothetical protein